MQPAAFLSAWSALSAGEYSLQLTQSIYTEEETPIYLPQITQIYADKPQNSINRKQTVFLCDIMQLAAFLSASSALSAGEYTSKLTQSIYTEEPPVSPANFADLRRRNPKNPKQPLPQTNCLSLRDNAACCIPLRDLRYLRENNTQEYSINLQTRNHSISRRSRRFTQTKPQNNKTAITATASNNLSFSAI